MTRLLAIILLLFAGPLAAQVFPQPDPTNPRLQSVQPIEGQEIMLAVLPQSEVTVVFPPSELIQSIVANRTTIAYSLSPERNALVLTPRAAGTPSSLDVTTDRRSYRFSVRTGDDLMAAYMVRIVDRDAMGAQRTASIVPSVGDGRWWSYRLKGKRSVQPVGIRDDGNKTYILFSPDQLLPAVFAISPTGDETLTNGYMRGSQFVLDRVWSELVFRIDDKKATARRNEQPDG